MTGAMVWRAAWIVAAGMTVYLPGLTGGFNFDDYHNIVDNPQLEIAHLDFTALLDAAFSSDAGPLKRPVAMLSFAVNRTLSGRDPLAYKITNLAIHLVNGLLVLLLARALLRRMCADPDAAARLAWIVALVWVVHPLHLTAVLYVVQRMTSLSAMGVLICVLAYVTARERMLAGAAGARGLLTVAAGGLVLGLLSKENAALAPLYLLVVEGTLYRFAGPRSIRWLFLCGLGAPAVAVLAAVAVHPDLILGDYVLRPYTVAQRLLTEARVLVFYLRLIVLPAPAALGLFHDDLMLSTGWLEPPQTALAFAALIAAAGFAWRRWRKAPFWGFALGWFLAGHVLESSVLPLDLVYEYRNYLPALGPIVGGVVLADRWLTGRAGRLVATGVVAALAAVTAARAFEWSDPVVLAQAEAAHHPRSQSATYELGRTYYRLYELDGDPRYRDQALATLRRAVGLGAEDFMAQSALLIARRQQDPELIETLARTLRDDAPIPRRLNAVQQNIACQAEGACPTDPRVVLRLAGAALQNPRLDAHARARVLEWLAVYYINVLGEFDRAVEILREIVAQYPQDATFRIRLAEALAHRGERVAARTLLAAVRAQWGPWDRWFARRSLVVRLRRVEALLGPDAR